MARPRRVHAHRYPGGKIRREAVMKDDDPRHVRASALWRQKHGGQPKREPKPSEVKELLDPLAQTEIGRLALAERGQTGAGITAEQLSAAEEIARAYASYYRAVLDKWPWPVNASIKTLPELAEAEESPSPDRLLESQEDRAKRITSRYMQIQGAMLNAGKGAWHEAEQVILYGERCRKLAQLRSALDWVRSDLGMA